MISKAQMFKWALIALMKTLAIALLHQRQHAHTARSTALRYIPPRSPDRGPGAGCGKNSVAVTWKFPCEKPAISKVAYRACVRTVLRAQKAQRVAT